MRSLLLCHRETASTHLEICEVSTPRCMDVIHHVVDYGREGTTEP